MPELNSYDKESAEEVINIAGKWQKKLIDQEGYNYIYLSDEFYLISDKNIPEKDHYNEFPQLENGIGMTRLELDNYKEIKDIYDNRDLEINEEITIITSELGWLALKSFWKEINSLSENIKVEVIKNKYLGGGVTVTGLLAAEDIFYGLSDDGNSGILILPDIIFNDNGLTLDDYGIKDFKNTLDYDRICKASEIKEILEVIFDGTTDCCNSG